jgi:hypothetical protein
VGTNASKSRGWSSGARIAAACAAWTGCTSLDFTDDGGAPPPPDGVEIAVPSDPPALEVAVACIERRAGERLVGVSPEGDAWLAGELDAELGTAPWRVVRAAESGLDAEERAIAVPSGGAVIAWSAATALAAAGDALYRIEGASRVAIGTPSGFRSPASLCGDPELDGLVVSEGRVARRADAVWRTFRPEDDGLARPVAVLAREGACAAGDGRAWIVAEDGSLARLDATSYAPVVAFGSIDDAAASASILAIVAGRDVWIGDGESTWSRLLLASKGARVAAAEGRVFFAMQSRVTSYDGERFAAYVPREGESIDAIGAHASGVWTTSAGSVCHAAWRAPLRIEGIRAFERVRDEARAVCLGAKPAQQVVAAGMVVSQPALHRVFVGQAMLRTEGARLRQQLGRFKHGRLAARHFHRYRASRGHCAARGRAPRVPSPRSPARLGCARRRTLRAGSRAA